jgi:hypothetical protein
MREKEMRVGGGEREGGADTYHPVYVVRHCR